MRNIIQEHLPYPESERELLWEGATFIFDTNVLLNLYRYSVSVRNTLITAIESLNGNVWMPYHVAQEFMKNRPKVILETSVKYKEMATVTDKMLSTFKNDFRISEKDRLYVNLKKYMAKWVKDYTAENSFTLEVNADELLEKLLALFENKAGCAFDKEELVKIKIEGKERYSKKVPPGYKDAGKAEKNQNEDDDNNTYGDFIIWKEILRFSKDNKKDIIFITHDQKEDWWQVVSGRTIGPRPELRKEFSETTQQKLHMYTMESFIYLYEQKVNIPATESVVNEVKDVDSARNPKSLKEQIEELYGSLNPAQFDCPDVLQELTLNASIEYQKLKEAINRVQPLVDYAQAIEVPTISEIPSIRKVLEVPKIDYFDKDK